MEQLIKKQQVMVADQPLQERNLALLILNTEEPFVMVDPELNIITFNHQFEKQYFNYFGVHIIKGSCILNYTRPENVERLTEIYQQALKGICYRTEMEVMTADKTTLFFELKFKPAYDDDNQIVGVFVSSTELSEIKKTQELVAISEQRYRALVENGSDAIAIMDTAGNPIYVSPSVKKVLGYTEEEAMQLNMFSSLHPDDVAAGKKAFERALANPGVSIPAYISRLWHKDGTWHWYDSVITNMLHVPSIKGIVSNFRDITEKVIIEQEREFDRQNTFALINNTNDLMWSISKEGKLITSNRAFDDMVKYMSGNAVVKGGDAPVAGFSEEQLKKWGGHYARAFAGETFTIVEYTDFPQEFWSEISFYPIRKENEIIGTACYSRNITERKLFERKLEQHVAEKTRADEEVRVAKERYDLVTKATNDAIYDWDLETDKVVRTGDGFKVLFGYDPEEAGKIPGFWKLRVHPDDVVAAYDRLYSFVNDPTKKVCDMEYRFLKSDGSYAYVYDKGYIVRDLQGKAIRIIGATQDITQRMESELKLKVLNEKLEKRAEELAVSNAELEQFAYIASHDLQEPLRMVTSFLGMLETKYGDLLDDKAKKYIFFATDGAVRMRRIILDLLEYSRVGRQANDKTEIDSNELLDGAVQLNRAVIDEKGAHIEWKDLPVITGNKTTLQQVFQNLIGNALKYQKQNAKPMVKISASETDTHWQFAVTDNGIGIEQKYFEKIFVVFQRLHNKDEFSGTGIGLAICKKIIDTHQGRIWVESTYGSGSTFYFTILKEKAVAA